MALKVHHLNCGTLCPTSRLIFNGEGGLWESGKLVCHCLLVETEAGLVLVDTGIGTQDIAHGFLNIFLDGFSPPIYAEKETALAQVQALGFAPEDVRHIVVTHMDLDHAGGLRDFPWARVHLHFQEYKGATQRQRWGEKFRYLPRQWRHGVLWEPYTPRGEKWFGFEAVRKLRGLPEDILLIPLLGHSRGHSGVAVNSEAGWLLHCGDAYYDHDQLQFPFSTCPVGLGAVQLMDMHDPLLWGYNMLRLQRLYHFHRDEVKLFCAHDPDEFAAWTA